MLVKLPHSTMTFGMKLFSMQLSNIFRRPSNVSGLSNHTSESTKNLRSGSSSCTRLANCFYIWVSTAVWQRKALTHILKQCGCSLAEEVNVAKY